MYNTIMNLRGPEFLQFFFVTEVIATGIAFYVRKSIVNLASATKTQGLNFDAYEAAYLNDGSKHAFLSAVATLEERKNIKIVSDSRSIQPVQHPDMSVHWVERMIYTTANEDKKLSQIFDQLKPNLEQLRNKLADAGLVASLAAEQQATLVAVAIVLSPIVTFAIPKALVAMQRHRPIELLILLSLVTLPICFKLLTTAVVRTKKGDEQLKEWQEKGDHLKANCQYNRAAVSPLEITMAYALFGAFGASQLDPFNNARKAMSSVTASGGGCGGSGGGGGGCGGGCGGCGG